MSRLDKYQSALLAAFPDVSADALVRELDTSGSEFAAFIIDHGLGPQWHLRTGRAEFHDSRLAAEALFLAQEHALKDIDDILETAGIEYALIKGAANRLALYGNPAIRACHDVDLLVHSHDRVQAASALVDAGFVAEFDPNSISRELMLTRADVTIDLHWALLREGRLRHEPVKEMLSRRTRQGVVWTLGSADALFMLLVHPAFAKHLAGWDMGLHRVMDIVEWLRTQEFNWKAVCDHLESNGVRTAAWATLRWIELLSGPHALPHLDPMMSDIRPGRLRRAWLNRCLKKDYSARSSDRHWIRLLGFTPFLHDTMGDAMRAFVGREKARRRTAADLGVFAGLDNK
jgi:hypothetical protein